MTRRSQDEAWSGDFRLLDNCLLLLVQIFNFKKWITNSETQTYRDVAVLFYFSMFLFPNTKTSAVLLPWREQHWDPSCNVSRGWKHLVLGILIVHAESFKLLYRFLLVHSFLSRLQRLRHGKTVILQFLYLFLGHFMWLIVLSKALNLLLEATRCWAEIFWCSWPYQPSHEPPRENALKHHWSTSIFYSGVSGNGSHNVAKHPDDQKAIFVSSGNSTQCRLWF